MKSLITVGILIAYIIALIVFRSDPGGAGTLDWRLLLGFGAIPAVIGLFFRARMPESPRWLLRHGDYDKAHRTFSRLGIDVSRADLEHTADQLHRQDRRQSQVKRRAWTPGVKRALVVVSGFFVFQQITGINVPLYYGPHLLGNLFAGGHASKVNTTIAGVEVTAIMTAVNVAATYLAFRFIDKIGRRKLAIGGYIGMAVFAIVSAVGLGALGGMARVVVSMIGLDLFIASFAIGVGGTGWLIQGESFPTAVRGEAASIGATFDWVANFALIEVFPVWQSGIGLPWVMVCFAGLCLVALVLVHRFLPETKNKSLEEINQIYEDEATAGNGSGHRHVSRWHLPLPH